MTSLQPAKLDKSIISLDIKDLIKAGLSTNVEFEINPDFQYIHELQSDYIFDLIVSRSQGWAGNLELHYGFTLENDSADENFHISQEIAVYVNADSSLCFRCPLLGEEEFCTKLYLRPDFPLFGSKRALALSN